MSARVTITVITMKETIHKRALIVLVRDNFMGVFVWTLLRCFESASHRHMQASEYDKIEEKSLFALLTSVDDQEISSMLMMWKLLPLASRVPETLTCLPSYLFARS